MLINEPIEEQSSKQSKIKTSKYKNCWFLFLPTSNFGAKLNSKVAGKFSRVDKDPLNVT